MSEHNNNQHTTNGGEHKHENKHHGSHNDPPKHEAKQSHSDESNAVHEKAELVKLSDSAKENQSPTDDEYLGELKGQAQEYGQKIQDAADKAKVYANEKIAQAGDKFNELKDKEPGELVDEAKEFAREKPGQTILISAAVGLVVGLIFGRGRK